ncbi:HAD hydrolase-like protein [bacterium AH-315-J21]|nr:HAD hydrolase-like protein [bacterium AH-315-J21]
MIHLGRIVPNYRCKSILELPSLLETMPYIDGLIFDVDQTILLYGDALPSEEIARTLSQLNLTFSCCMLSNSPKNKNRDSRLQKLSEYLDIPLVLAASRKPDQEAFAKAIDHLKLGKNSVAIVGDRVLTDIFGGNLFGITTILVEPLSTGSDPILLVTFPRIIESMLLRTVIALRNKTSG